MSITGFLMHSWKKPRLRYVWTPNGMAVHANGMYMLHDTKLIEELERENAGLKEQCNAIAHTRTFEQTSQIIADLKQQLADMTTERNNAQLEVSAWKRHHFSREQYIDAMKLQVKELVERI